MHRNHADVGVLETEAILGTLTPRSVCVRGSVKVWVKVNTFSVPVAKSDVVHPLSCECVVASRKRCALPFLLMQSGGL